MTNEWKGHIKVKQEAILRRHPAKRDFFDQFSKLRTQCAFKNIRVKAPSEYHN